MTALWMGAGETEDAIVLRRAGTILHISSLPSPYGIGTMGQDAYDFVDFLKKAGLRYWQVLPLVPAGSGNSPYASYSTFAGNPDLIDLDFLQAVGLLERKELTGQSWGKNPARVDFDTVHRGKLPLLEKAYTRLTALGQASFRPENLAPMPEKPLAAAKESSGKEKPSGKGKETLPSQSQTVTFTVTPPTLSLAAMQQFRLQHADWVEDYALYMAVKERNEDKPWYQWPEDIAQRQPQAVAYWSSEVKARVDFWVFVQYLFFTQWEALKFYANERDVEIIGDLPIYVLHDSVDVWVNRKYFWLNRDNSLAKVAGVPPDAFSDMGQRWGNPLYRWDLLEDDGFGWWIHRIRRNAQIYDWVRIDHFRGFDQFYAIDRDEPDARHGEWCEGSGYALFQQIEKELGRVKILAEDLGVITPSVRRLLRETGFPGMKVLQFACSGPDNAYLPHNCEENAFLYTGTHDNDTAAGWVQNGDPKEVAFAKRYFGLNAEEGYHWGLIRGALGSRCVVAMAQMQDFLGLGSEHRMNVPATPSGNWGFRMVKGASNDALAEKIRELLYCFGRLG